MIKIFLILVFFFGLKQLHPDSYSDYRMDDISYSKFGKVDYLTKDRRPGNNYKKKELSNSLSIQVMRYFTGRYYTQNGGAKENLTGRYESIARGNPEINLFYDKKTIQVLFLISPILRYREEEIIQKQSGFSKDSEFIFGLYGNFSFINLKFQTGRGFQRLDNYGLFFSGISHFASASLVIDKFASLNLIGLSPTNKPFSSENKTSPRISGGNLSFQGKKFGILNLSYYRMVEPLQISRPAWVNSDSKEFKPFGNFYYYGLEYTSPTFLENFFFEAGGFIANGYRKMNEYKFQYAPNISTHASLFYTSIIMNDRYILPKKSSLKFGGLVSSSDESLRTDSKSDGFSSPSPDPRIFGGRGSFLLTGEIAQNEPTSPFSSEMVIRKKPDFENRGIKFLSSSFNYKLMDNFNFIGILNLGRNMAGKGGEFILQTVYYPRWETFGSFFVLSFCKARLTQEKNDYLISNFPIPEKDTREFTRIYFSAGIYF